MLDEFGLPVSGEAIEQLIADMFRITIDELRKRRECHRRCPSCDGPTVEILTLTRPTGPTGIYKCLVCDAWHDPTFKEMHFSNPHDQESEER